MSRSAGRHRDEQHMVRQAATRVRRGVFLARAATALLPLLLTAWGAFELRRPGRFYAVLAVVVVAAPLMWALTMSLWSRPAEPETGVGLNIVGEPTLYQHLVDLAKRLDVRTPADVRVVPGPMIEVKPHSTTPSLHVGAAALWNLTAPEFERLLAHELSILRCLRGAELQATWRVIERVNLERLVADRTPVVGWVVRRFGRLVTRRLDRFLDAVRAWSEHTLPADLRPTEADLREQATLEDAWSIVVDKWVSSARAVGRPLGTYADATRRMVQACEQDALLDRDSSRQHGVLAATLLVDADSVDTLLSQWLNRQWSLPDQRPVPWEDYPHQIAVPAWERELRIALGVNAGTAVTLDSALAAASAHGGRSTSWAMAAVRLALLRSATAELSWSWVWGPVLHDADGNMIEVEGLFGDTVDAESVDHALIWLHRHGVNPAVTVMGDGADPLPGADRRTAHPGPVLATPA